MKILSTPHETQDNCEELTIPESLKPFIVSWATRVSYCSYSFGEILKQEYISKDVSIFIYQFIVPFPGSFYAGFDEPTIAFQFMMEGSVNAMLQGLQTPINKGYFGLFYLPASINEVKLVPGSTQSIHFELTAPYIEDLAATEKSVQELLEKLFETSNTADRLAPVPVTYEVKQYLEKLCKCNEVHAGLQMELKVIILSLLNIYRKGVQLKEDINLLPATFYKDKIIAIGEAIQQHADKRLYSIYKLREQYHLSEYSLRKGFKQIWKESLSNFIYHQCMEKAKLLLMNSKLTPEEIAEEIGYENASNFSKAFKRYSGKNPGEMRKSSAIIPKYHY